MLCREGAGAISPEGRKALPCYCDMKVLGQSAQREDCDMEVLGQSAQRGAKRFHAVFYVLMLVFDSG
eukprot:1156900-Pelagomonas_calceolata.AAC.5